MLDKCFLNRKKPSSVDPSTASRSLAVLTELSPHAFSHMVLMGRRGRQWCISANICFLSWLFMSKTWLQPALLSPGRCPRTFVLQKFLETLLDGQVAWETRTIYFLICSIPMNHILALGNQMFILWTVSQMKELYIYVDVPVQEH